MTATAAGQHFASAAIQGHSTFLLMHLDRPAVCLSCDTLTMYMQLALHSGGCFLGLSKQEKLLN